MGLTIQFFGEAGKKLKTFDNDSKNIQDWKKRYDKADDNIRTMMLEILARTSLKMKELTNSVNEDIVSVSVTPSQGDQPVVFQVSELG